MRKIAIALAAALLVQTSAHAGGDSWTGPDKVMHFGVGAALGTFGTLASESKGAGFGLGCLAGLAKEVADRGGSGFSARDWGVTCAGALLGAQLGGYLVQATRHGVLVRKEF